MRHALNGLAVVAPDWLQSHSRAEWVGRYGRRVEDYRLPTGKQERHAYAELVGADGHALLSAIYDPQSPQWLREVPAIETLRQVWVQQFYLESEKAHWRTEKEGIPLEVISWDKVHKDAKMRNRIFFHKLGI